MNKSAVTDHNVINSTYHVIGWEEAKIIDPVAEWLRPLIFSALNPFHLTAVGSSLARVTRETSQVLPAGGQVVFLADVPFSPHLTIDSAQNEWNNFDGP